MKPAVLLSGFSDEAANQKLAVQQFSALAALGMEYLTLRFIDMGNGIKNAMLLDDDEIDRLVHQLVDYDLKISSLGSPIGKVKLLDREDGTHNRFVPFEHYLQHDVEHACNLANKIGCKLIRGFSFYHPRGDDPHAYIEQAADQLGQIAEVVDSHGLTFGLEVEANLIGHTGTLLRTIYDRVLHPAMVLIFDGANLVCQGMSTEEVYDEYLAMKPGLGWLHIKDYKSPKSKTANTGESHIDEDSLRNFVPVDIGDSGHLAIFKDFAGELPNLQRKMERRGVAGVFLDLEPHLKGGGQFGGFSGPDGFGVALRALCKMLDQTGITYSLRSFETLNRQQ